MRSIRKHKKGKKLKLSDFAAIKTVKLNKNDIQVWTRLKLDMLIKVKNNEIILDKADTGLYIRKIFYEQIRNKDDITQEELKDLESEKIFFLIEEIKRNDKFVNKYLDETIKNPLLQFLVMIIEHNEKLIDEKHKQMNVSIKLQGDLKKATDDLLITWSKIDKNILDSIYDMNNIPFQDRDYSKEKLNKAHKVYNEIIYADVNRKNHCCNVLEGNGWFIDCEFEKEEQECIIQLSEDQSSLNGYILSLFDYGDLDEMFSMWNDTGIIVNRMHILDKCIKALKEEQYDLFIPVMFSQLEGIVVDVFSNQGKYNYAKIISNVKELCERKDNTFNKRAEEFYLNVILSGFEVGEKSLDLSRHAILHGYNVDYGTKENAFRVLLYFHHILINLYSSSTEE